MSSISVSLYSNGRMIIIKISCCSQCQQKLIYWQKIHGRTQRLIKLFTLQPFCNIVSLISVYHLCLSFRQYCMPQQVSAWWQSPLKAGVIPRKCTGFPFVQFKRLVRGGQIMNLIEVEWSFQRTGAYVKHDMFAVLWY